MLKNFTNKKLNFYRQVQNFFKRTSFLIHFDCNRVLYIDIDVSKQRDFKSIIYYLKLDVNLKKSRCFDIESIMFLSRLLNLVETRY